MVMRAVVAILTENCELQMIVGKRGFVPLPSGKLVLMPHQLGRLFMSYVAVVGGLHCSMAMQHHVAVGVEQ
jgi:hypothetical protein